MSSIRLIAFVSKMLLKYTMKTIEQIRRENLNLLAEANGGIKWIADKIERSQSQVSQWATAATRQNGNPSNISASSARRIEELCGLESLWLDVARSQSQLRAEKTAINTTGHSNVSYMRQIVTYNSLDELHDDEFVLIPQIDIKLSAGTGQVNPHIDEKNPLPFMAGYIKELKIDPKNALTMKIEGRSMETDLYDGDTVIIDRGDCHPTVRGGVYAITIQDEWMVKRVKKNVLGGVDISSDNSDGNFFNESLTDEQAANAGLEIVGRVRYRSGRGGNF